MVDGLETLTVKQLAALVRQWRKTAGNQWARAERLEEKLRRINRANVGQEKGVGRDERPTP